MTNVFVLVHKFPHRLTIRLVCPQPHQLSLQSAELEQVREETKIDCKAIREYQRQRNDHGRRLLPPDTDTFTSRGIEHLASTDALQERHISRTRHWRFVMEERTDERWSITNRH